MAMAVRQRSKFCCLNSHDKTIWNSTKAPIQSMGSGCAGVPDIPNIELRPFYSLSFAAALFNKTSFYRSFYPQPAVVIPEFS